MRVDVARLVRRVLVLVVVSGLPALAVTAPSGWPSAANVTSHASSSGFADIRLKDVASRVGLNLRQGAFRFGVRPDPAAMTGGGLCALDYNNDGWVDLFVVSSYSQADVDRWQAHGGLPRSALFRNTRGRFRNVTRTSRAGLAVRGQGCVAADFNGDGYTDVFITADGQNKLLWNNGNGTFTEGAWAAGIRSYGWHTGAAVADVNGEGRPDLFVANDGDPNRRYQNVAWPGGRKADPAGLGFRFEERAASAGVADPNAGMGVAAADFNGDGRTDLFISNSRGQGHAVYTGQPPLASGSSFKDVRAAFEPAFGKTFTGWGAAWVDLDLDGHPDLVLTNGGVPVTNLARNAQPIQVLENMGAPPGSAPQFTDGTALVGGNDLPRVVGRGLTTADFDNDGRMDIAINTIGGKAGRFGPPGGLRHWLAVRLARFSPGAVVTAVLPDGRRLVREVQAGSSYLSSQDPRLHFGLGDATKVTKLVVRYPGGAETHLTDVAADQVVVVARTPYLVD